MDTEIRVENKAIIADRNLYATADENEIVEQGDARGRFLVAAAGSQIDPRTVQRYGLKAADGKVKIGKPGEDADGNPLPGGPAGTPNEGQLRAPGEPLILTPRTGVMRSEPAPRNVPQPGEEVDISVGPVVAVSNVPAEDDALRAAVAKETAGGKTSATLTAKTEEAKTEAAAQRQAATIPAKPAATAEPAKKTGRAAKTPTVVAAKPPKTARRPKGK